MKHFKKLALIAAITTLSIGTSIQPIRPHSVLVLVLLIQNPVWNEFQR